MEKNTRESKDNKLTVSGGAGVEEDRRVAEWRAGGEGGGRGPRLNGRAGSPLIVETLCCLLRACDFLNREKEYRQQTVEER